jgi:cyclohexanecarboxylate-CoA ligase
MSDIEMPLATDERFERHRENGEWLDKTLLEYFQETLAETPDKPAAVDPRLRLTYEEVDDRSDCIAAGLREAGIGAGDIVTVQLPNWTEWLEIRLALMKLGAAINPIPVNYRTSDLEYIIDLVEPTAYILPDSYSEHDFVSMAREELNYDGHIFTLSEDPGKPEKDREQTSIAELRETNSSGESFPGTDPNQLSELPFTSGTTGNPKGCIMTQNTLNSAVKAYNERANLEEEATVLCAMTIGHQGGYGYGAYPPIQSGGTVVFMETRNWSGDAGVATIAKENVTHMWAPTPFLHDIVYADSLAEHDVSSLEFFAVGGASVSQTLLEDANDSLDADVVGSYGQTEDALATMTFPDDPPKKKIKTDGYPLSGMEFEIRDPDDEFPGDTGRLVLRGPFLMLGFYGHPEKTLEAMEGGANGWYRTGDLAKIDDDGYISITGREKFVIMRGGEQVPVKKVEELLYKHPNVDEVAIVAMPDDRLQEKACAYVVPEENEEFSFDEMFEYLEEKDLTKQYFPERLELVDEFPRSVSGNIERHELRKDIADKIDKEPVMRN